jgi:hypothetical protein
MKKVVAVVLINLVLLHLALTGCSAFVPATQMVSIACSEPDATLQVNGQEFEGSAQIDAPRNKNLNILCTKPGYFPAEESIGFTLSDTGAVDMLGVFVFLLPVIGLFTGGAWTLEETDVSVSMTSSEKKH